MNVLHDATGHNIIHRQSCAAGFFHDIIDHFPFPESMKKRSKGAYIHSKGSPPKLMRSQSRQFIHQHTYHFSPLRHFDLQPLLDTKRTTMIVDMR